MANVVQWKANLLSYTLCTTFVYMFVFLLCLSDSLLALTLQGAVVAATATDNAMLASPLYSSPHGKLLSKICFARSLY